MLPSAVMNRRNCDALQDTPHSVIMMRPRLAVLGGLSAARQRGLRASQRPIRSDVLGLEALQSRVLHMFIIFSQVLTCEFMLDIYSRDLNKCLALRVLNLFPHRQHHGACNVRGYF